MWKIFLNNQIKIIFTNNISSHSKRHPKFLEVEKCKNADYFIVSDCLKQENTSVFKP